MAFGSALAWTLTEGEEPRPTRPIAATPDASTLQWHDVASWESSGDDDSPSFHISADSWRILWDAPHDTEGDGEIAIHVYNPDGYFVRLLYDTAHSPELNLEGSLRGSLDMQDPGEYFLRALTGRDYHLTVQELR